MTNTPKPAPRFFFDPNQGAIYDRTRNGKRVQTDYTFTPTSLCSLLNELFPASPDGAGEAEAEAERREVGENIRSLLIDQGKHVVAPPVRADREAVATKVQNILAIELGINSAREIVGIGPASFKIADALSRQPPQSSSEMSDEAFVADLPERQPFNQWADPMVVDKDGETGEVAAVASHQSNTPTERK